MNPISQMTHADVAGSSLTSALFCKAKHANSPTTKSRTNAFCVSVAQLELKFCRSCSQNMTTIIII